MKTSRVERTVATSFDLAILAEGMASLSLDKIAAARQTVGGKFSAALKPQLLKHSDPQTLSAIDALSAATDQLGRFDDFDLSGAFGDWAIISATQYLGRSAFAAVIEKYQIDGPWGVSVQVIPHTSPHAVASTLSLALASHGPCIGVGAAPGEEPQALLTAATLLQRPEIPGAWLVLSGWLPEQTTDDARQPAVEGRCQAAALAVVCGRSAAAGGAIGRITFRMDSTASSGDSANLLTWLMNAIRDRESTHRTASGNVRIAVEWFGAPRRQTENCQPAIAGSAVFGPSPPLAGAAVSHF